MSVWMSKAEKVAYVKRQRQSRPHTCHWPGCGRQVPPALWGCSFHWRQLPQDLRAKIWVNYVPGQEKTMTPSRAYVEVCAEVEKFFQDAGIITLKTQKIVGEKSHDTKSTGEKKMKVTLHLEGTRQEIVAQIDEARLVYTSSLEAQPAKGAKKAAAKTKKAAKDEDAEEEEDAEEVEADEDEEESEEDEADEDEEEEAAEDDDEEDADEEEEESSSKGPKKEAVVKALKTYAAKGAKFKDKAMAALGSFKSAAGKKVKHVDDMKKSDYALLLKKLK